MDRKVGGRGLVSVRHEQKQLNRYMMNSRESVMQAVYERVKIKEADEGESRVDKWTGKVSNARSIHHTD